MLGDGGEWCWLAEIQENPHLGSSVKGGRVPPDSVTVTVLVADTEPAGVTWRHNFRTLGHMALPHRLQEGWQLSGGYEISGRIPLAWLWCLCHKGVNGVPV